MNAPSLGWFGIVRLGLVQSAIGAMVMLSTSLLNRVMVVEYALPAALPAGLVAWHYAVQLSRPLWGHGSDSGRRRTPWIIGGMIVLALGSMLAVQATIMSAAGVFPALIVAILAFAMIGAGVGAAGTSLLAVLASHVARERRAAAASLTWIMMVVGIVVTAGVAGALLDPFSADRLRLVAGGVALTAVLIATLAMFGVECVPEEKTAGAPVAFGTALAELWGDAEARWFTVFVFVSMLAYSMQDMILEPFAGLLFAYTPGQSTQLSGVQHAGVLAGMILVGIGGSAFAGRARDLRSWTVGGCILSAIALLGLVAAARVAPHWPIALNVAMLGFGNGVFAVAAIGAMMTLAGEGGTRTEGLRMGVWGAAQAIAFGLGGLAGAVGVDVLRRADASAGNAFGGVFTFEAGLFVAAACIAASAVRKPQRQLQGAMA